MNILVSHATGNSNVRAVIEKLSNINCLAGFITSIAVKKNSPWLHLLPHGLQAEFLRKTFPIPDSQVICHSTLEIIRLLLPKLGLKGVVKHEYGFACIDAVYRDLDIFVAKYVSKNQKIKNIEAVYCYEDGALSTFTQAKKSGITCIYDLPIAYWETLRKLLYEEVERMPEWRKTLGGGLTDSEAKLERKTRELELADIVVGPGKFVLDSIPIWAYKKKLIISPFGSPINEISDKISALPLVYLENGRPMRVLFVGSMGQRKGLGDLFKAIKLLNTNRIELVVMGSLLDDLSFYKSQLSNFTYENVRSHTQVLELMRTCDIFCLPSIVEGRALVMQEAMSQGLPVIITPNTGGEDLVIEGKTGFLVPIRSPEKIAEKLNWCLEHRSEVAVMGTNARRHANNYTWENYSEIIIKGINSI